MQTTENKAAPAIPEGYMRNAQGYLVPVEKVSDIDRARDDLVREIIDKANALREQMATFKKAAMADLSAFVDLSAEKYGVKMGGTKGNVTFSSFDGRYKIRIDNNECLVFDERLQIAKKLVDECIHKWAEGSGAEIRALVEHAFQTDKEGRISVSRVLSLTRLKIDDQQWKSAMQAVHDSMQIAGTTTYMRIHRRIGDGEKYEQVSLDFSRL